MDLTVLYLGAPNLSTLRAAPPDLPAVETSADRILDVARGIATKHLLVIEPHAYPSAQTFAAARALDARGGVLGGCAIEGEGTRRFGAVFASVEFGPYEVEPFPLIDTGSDLAQQPQRNAIDVVASGAFIVDRECLCAVGAFDRALGSPWRIYDLCMRVRELGKPVRWDPSMTFSVEVGVVPPADAVDRRDFLDKWGTRLKARFDLDTPARGLIRRTWRLPLGQREIVTIPIPSTELVLYGEGELTPKLARSLTRAQRVSVTDARGDEPRAVRALGEALRTRSDRYVAFLHAASTPSEGWLERMLADLESRPHLRGVRDDDRGVLALPRIPLDKNPPETLRSLSEALDEVLSPREPAGKAVSVILVAHAGIQTHRTSFELVYGGELDIDYHAVVTSSQPGSVAALHTYATLDVIVDDSRNMAAGVNAAMSRARGDIVVVIADDFYPPPSWLDTVRESFALRPDMGILGFSSVFVDGPQCVDLAYSDVKAFKMLASRRRAERMRDAKLTEQLCALALAIDARALAAVGGFDKKLGVGRWGVEDLTVRIRRAGYTAYVAEDLFLHRFDASVSQPFLMDATEEARSARTFAEKWNRRTDFDPERDYVALK